MKRITLNIGFVLLCALGIRSHTCHASEFVDVGMYAYAGDPDKKEIKLLMAEFEKNHVSPNIFGSKGYTITVPSTDAAKARKMIADVVLKNNLKTIWAIDEKGHPLPIKKE